MAKMKKYASLTDEKINEIVAAYDDTKLKAQEGCFARDLAKLDFPFKKKKADGTTIWITKDYMTKIHNAMVAEIAKRNGETNVNENLPKKSPKTMAKPKKNDYINTTNETKTTNSNGDKTMMNKVLTKNEIAKIAPNAVKNILAAQNKNKTDTKKTYWGGWGKVRAGMNSAYNDYNKFQELENQWAELRNRLGKGPKGHFCWSLINKNRVGVKQEPNSTLRFIKNVKIRIAMANDVLAGKYTKTQIDEYMNGLSAAYKLKYGLV